MNKRDGFAQAMLAIALGSITGTIFGFAFFSSLLGVLCGAFFGGLTAYFTYRFEAVIKTAKATPAKIQEKWQQAKETDSKERKRAASITFVVLSIGVSLSLGLILIRTTPQGSFSNYVGANLLAAFWISLFGLFTFPGHLYKETSLHLWKVVMPVLPFTILYHLAVVTTWAVPRIPQGIKKTYSVIVKASKAVGFGMWWFFKTIHSEVRLFCFAYAAFGASTGVSIGIYTNSLVVGIGAGVMASVGFGVPAWKFLTKGVFKVVNNGN